MTDEDSADEDDSGLIDNLSGRQLTGNAEAVFHDGRRTTEDDCEAQLSGNDEAIFRDERRSTEHDGEAHNSSPINSYKTPKWSLGTSLTPGDCIFPEANYAKYRDFTPVELFELFFDDDMWNLLVDQTIVYATLQGETDFLVSKDEMKVFLGILIVSGIVPVSSRRMFWRNSSVTRNEAVYQAMRRRRFEKIMQFIHFSDNSSLDATDKYAKVRPLFRHLTKKFIEHFQPVKSLSHDEAMVEYYGKHGCKQCIRMKPIRFGYKAWCLNTDDGYLVTFDLYQGCTYEGNELNEKVFGKCAATVLKNIDSLPEDKRSLPYNIYFDNLFTSFELLKELKDRNYGATGTIRANRCKHCPLKSVDVMKRQKRGTAEFASDKVNKIMVCRWMDNAVVSVASTVHTSNASSKVRRYSKSEKQNVEIDCPKIVQEYNQHMGGTDRQDQNVNKYRIAIRGKKWYWSIFTWMIDVTVQNAWLLHKKSGGGLSQFEFKEQIAQTYLTRYGTPPKGAGRPPSYSTKGDKRVLEDIRFDGIEHYLVETQDNKRRRCAGEGCKKRPFSQCGKCNVGLCLACNLSFHTK